MQKHTLFFKNKQQIMFKKIFSVAVLALALTACTGDYTDWAQPEQNAPVEAIQGKLNANATSYEVDLNNEGETVKLFDVDATLFPENTTIESYKVNLANENGGSYDVYADAEGYVKTEDLNNAVIYLFNREVVGRYLSATVSTNATVKGQQGEAVVAYTADSFHVTLTCIAPKFEPYIYFIGATDGWSKAEQRLVSDDNGGYTGYIYCADPNNWGNQFKFQRVAGDWGTEINNSFFTEYVGAAEDCGGNIGVNAGEGVYYFDLNLSAGRISATKVEVMGIIGDFNGWSGDAVMTWDAANFCYVCETPGINANGWKFRVNSDWGLNLGGATLDNLYNNGENLTAVGNVVKLYPCRVNSDNIYCTVE